VKLVFSTSSYKVDGQSLTGFPLLLDDNLYPLEPAQDFLFYLLLESGGPESQLTWCTYSRQIYDFFAFLNANQLQWNAPPSPAGRSVVALYRNWSVNEQKLSNTTVNARLRRVVQFYKWSFANGHINHLPFTQREIKVNRDTDFLAHIRTDSSKSMRPNVILRELKKPLRFTTADQARICLEKISNSSHRLLFELMLRTGLRSCEARTFPTSYVFDPTKRIDLVPGQMINVHLNPKDMSIKYRKPRVIDVPWGLMQDMFSYMSLERNILLENQKLHTKKRALILTANGDSFSSSTIVSFFSELSKKTGFKISAHMLRHSYGTYTLSKLRKSINFNDEPLLYVRDRMGHSSVNTTVRYLHLINHIEGSLALKYESEIDNIFNKKYAED
jgi:integrase